MTNESRGAANGRQIRMHDHYATLSRAKGRLEENAVESTIDRPCDDDLPWYRVEGASSHCISLLLQRLPRHGKVPKCTDRERPCNICGKGTNECDERVCFGYQRKMEYFENKPNKINRLMQQMLSRATTTVTVQIHEYRGESGRKKLCGISQCVRVRVHVRQPYQSWTN